MKVVVTSSVVLSTLLFAFSAFGGQGLGGGGISRTKLYLKATVLDMVAVYALPESSGSPETEIDPEAVLNQVPQAEFNELNERLLIGQNEVDIVDENNVVIRTFVIQKGEGEFEGALVLVEKVLPKPVDQSPPSTIVK